MAGRISAGKEDAMIAQAQVSMGRLSLMVHEAIESRHIPALLDARAELLDALDNSRLPRKHKKSDGRIRVLLGTVHRELNRLNDEEARSLLRLLDFARQDAEFLLQKEQPAVKKVGALTMAIKRIYELCGEFSSRGFMIAALGRVKLGSFERGDEALDALFQIRDEFADKLAELKNSDSYVRAVHSARALLKAAQDTNNWGAVKAHLCALRELGAEA